MPKALRKNNLFLNFKHNEVAAVLAVATSLAILPKIIFSTFGHNFLFTFYNYKINGHVESFYQIENSFYFGYYLLITTIIIVYTLIFFPKIINHWKLKHFFVFSTLISCLFLGVLLIYGPWNTELYTEEITSAIVRIKHFFKGEILYWYDGRGFGTPLPTIQAPDTHPLFWLTPFISLRIVYSLFWIIHLTLGSFFYIRLSLLLGFDKSLSILSGFLFVFSMATLSGTVFYNFSSVFICWSMYPIISYYSFKLFLCESQTRIILIVTLALLIFFTVINGLPSYYAAYFIIFGLSILITLLFTPNPKLIKSFFLVFIISSLLAAPRVFYILNELSLFPKGIIGTHAQGSIDLRTLLTTNITPFSYVFFRELYHNIDNAFVNSIQRLTFHNSRTAFLGLVYLSLSLCSIFVLLKQLYNKNVLQSDKIKSVIIVAFFISLIGMTLPKDYFLDLISPWVIKDEMIFFGILTAGIILQRIKNSLFIYKNSIVILLLILQCTQVFGYSAYNIFFRFSNPLIMNQTNFYKPPSNGDKLFEFLLNNKKVYGSRILLSPDIERDLKKETAILEKEKFYSIPDINLYTGINVINDMLKCISMDRIYSTRHFIAGDIKSNYDLINNSSLLDIAGINWILIKNTELLQYGPFSGLITKEIFNFEWQDESWVLLHNDDAWPRAFAMSSGVLNIDASFRKGCGHTGLLCINMEPYLPYAEPVEVKVNGDNGHYDLAFPPREKNMVIGLSTMYRQEWEAYGGGKKLEIKPLYNAFIGVVVPPGITRISLDFNPKIRISLMYLSLITFLSCVVLIVIIVVKTRVRKYKV